MVGALTACRGSEAKEPAAELTRAQKYSIVTGMPIPGAAPVGGAMRARDAANARMEAHDTIRQGRPDDPPSAELGTS